VKYYEVRKNNNKVYLNETSIYNDRMDNNLIYEGRFPLFNHLKREADGFYSVEFRGMCDSITKDILLENGFDLDFDEEFEANTPDNRFKWVIMDSDHRKDVRIVDENTFAKLKNGETMYTICQTCEAIFSKHPISMKPTKIKATIALHQLGDISRMEEEIAIVTEADDENYYGNWCSGYGFIDVAFPINSSTIIED
jgi:hypothetical protein